MEDGKHPTIAAARTRQSRAADARRCTGGTDFLISIHNADGKLIDEVSDGDMNNDFNEVGITSFIIMRELYENARRVAMGVQVAIDEILNELGGKTKK